MKYDVKWFRYPHGIEGEEMIANRREFDSFPKALAFLEKRVEIIRSINWAGGHIEDVKGNWIYDITDCGEVIDNRKSEEPHTNSGFINAFKQHKILSSLYHDYISIDTETDLRKRKISFVDYLAIPEIFGEINAAGQPSVSPRQ